MGVRTKDRTYMTGDRSIEAKVAATEAQEREEAHRREQERLRTYFSEGDVSNATAFDSGAEFEDEGQVRDYFTVQAQRRMFGDEAIDDQALLDEMARKVIDNRWHMVDARERFLEGHNTTELLTPAAQFFLEETGGQAVEESMVEAYFEQQGPRMAKQLEEDYIAELVSGGVSAEEALNTALAVDFSELVASSWDEFQDAVRSAAETLGIGFEEN